MAFPTYGKALNITTENMLRILPSVPRGQLNNGLIGEVMSWHKQYGKKQKVVVKNDIVPVIAAILSEQYGALEARQYSSIAPLLYVTHKKYVDLKRRQKDRPEAFRAFCDTLFSVSHGGQGVPNRSSVGASEEDCAATVSVTCVSACSSSASVSVPHVSESSAMPSGSTSVPDLQAAVSERDLHLNSMQRAVDRKDRQINSTQQKLDRQRKRNKKQRKTFAVKKVQQDRRNQERKLKRKEKKIKKLTQQLQALKKQKLHRVYVRVYSPDTKAEIDRAVGSRTRKLRRQCTAKTGELESKIKTMQGRLDNRKSALSKKAKEVKDLKKQITALEEVNTKLHDDLIALRSPTSGVSTRIGRSTTFTSMVRESCFECLNAGVGEKQVSDLVERLYRVHTGRTLVGGMPSLSTVRTMTDDMKEIAKLQLRDALMDETEMTLVHDSTTKKGHSLVNVVVCTKAGKRFLVGVREMGGGTAVETSEAILTALSDISQRGDSERCQLLIRISNTMSDRCVTNNAISRKLSDAKGEELYDFKCGVHPLDTFARVCDAYLKAQAAFENLSLIVNSDQSQLQAFLIAYGKLTWDPKCNCKVSIEAFMAEYGPKFKDGTGVTFALERFSRTRFNCIFRHSGHVYLYAPYVKVFFTKVLEPANLLHRAVFQCLQGDLFDLQLRALGLISKFITGPWMKLVYTYKEGASILELNPYFEEAVHCIQNWAEDASPMLRPDTPCMFSKIDMARDEVFHVLIKGRGEDKNKLCNMLQRFSQLILDTIKRQLATQLEGGKFYKPSKELLEVAKSAPSSSMPCEQMFAMWDAFIASRPHVTSRKVEARVMCRANATLDWLRNKGAEEKEALMQQARASSVVSRQVEKGRADDLKKIKVQKMKDKAADLRNKEARELERTEKRVDEVKRFGGLWKTQSDMTNFLYKTRTKSTTYRVLALKAQIGFRRKVLKCKPLSPMCVSGANLSMLVDFMNTLFAVEVPCDTKEIEALLSGCEDDLVGRRFEQVWTDNAEGVGVEKVYHGTIAGTSTSDQGKPELKVTYDGSDGFFYIEHSELVADLIKRNFCFLPKAAEENELLAASSMTR